MESAARVALAQRRLQSVLSSHTVATARTLEQKIADAGPADHVVVCLAWGERPSGRMGAKGQIGKRRIPRQGVGEKSRHVRGR